MADPEVAHNFVQATIKGIQYALTHPAEFVAIMKKHQPQLNEDVAIKEIEILRELTSAGGAEQRLGRMTPQKMQQTVDLTTKYLDLKAPVAADQVFTNEFLS